MTDNGTILRGRDDSGEAGGIMVPLCGGGLIPRDNGTITLMQGLSSQRDGAKMGNGTIFLGCGSPDTIMVPFYCGGGEVDP